jgi:hypothetical protein
MGFERDFISPPLERGQEYTYTLRASWMENGKEVTREKSVPVRAGQEAMADFRPAGSENQPQYRGREQLPSSGTPKGEGERRLKDEGTRTDVDTPAPIPREKVEAGQPISADVIRIEGDQIVVTLVDGGQQRTFNVPSDAAVTVDGRKSELNSIKAGTRVSIVTKPNTTDVATKVDVVKTPASKGIAPPPKP